MNNRFLIDLSNGLSHSYKVNPSKRAKYIRIKLSNTGELSVTLPHRSSVKQAHNFIQSKSAWIEKHLAKLPPRKSKSIPTKLDLKLLDESWVVRIVSDTDDSPQLTEDGLRNTLCFSGSYEQIETFEILLAQWLKEKAKTIFVSMMEDLAEEHGFYYNRLSIRSQKTRWGSCSSNKNISLNCKLLFMSEEVVKYVMIHELSHTIQMNHSLKFWRLVEDCDPNYQEHRRELKQYKTF